MANTSAAEIIQQARARNRLLLTEVEAKALLSTTGVAVAQARLARTREEALDLARATGFPVVLKICSPDIVHKSDVGGVRLNLAASEWLSRPACGRSCCPGADVATGLSSGRGLPGD